MTSCMYTVFESAKFKLSKDSLPKTLKHLVDHVKKNSQTILWLPVLHSNHQVVIKVVFAVRVISYGLCFSESPRRVTELTLTAIQGDSIPGFRKPKVLDNLDGCFVWWKVFRDW